MKAGAVGLAARPIADPRGEFQDNLEGTGSTSRFCGSGFGNLRFWRQRSYSSVCSRRQPRGWPNGPCPAPPHSGRLGASQRLRHNQERGCHRHTGNRSHARGRHRPGPVGVTNVCIMILPPLSSGGYVASLSDESGTHELRKDRSMAAVPDFLASNFNRHRTPIAGTID